MSLPTDSAARKRIPVFSGVVAYFPDALVEVARVSFEGNEKHNPGQPLHWAREKSTDHEDCIQRHTIDALKAFSNSERVEHLACRAWRALAALQLAVEDRDEKGESFEEYAARTLAAEQALVGAYSDAFGPECEQCDEFCGLPSFYKVVP